MTPVVLAVMLLDILIVISFCRRLADFLHGQHAKHRANPFLNVLKVFLCISDICNLDEFNTFYPHNVERNTTDKQESFPIG